MPAGIRANFSMLHKTCGIIEIVFFLKRQTYENVGTQNYRGQSCKKRSYASQLQRSKEAIILFCGMVLFVSLIGSYDYMLKWCI
jgi:hypothetical protein